MVLLTVVGNRLMEAVLLHAHGVRGWALLATLSGRTVASLVMWYALAVWSRVSFMAGVARRRRAAAPNDTAPTAVAAGDTGGGGAARPVTLAGMLAGPSTAGGYQFAQGSVDQMDKKVN